MHVKSFPFSFVGLGVTKRRISKRACLEARGDRGEDNARKGGGGEKIGCYEGMCGRYGSCLIYITTS